jgi:hypothetical protein
MVDNVIGKEGNLGVNIRKKEFREMKNNHDTGFSTFIENSESIVIIHN